MKHFFLLITAACVAGASVSEAREARDVDIDIIYPVPVMPLEGWVPATITLTKRTASDRDFEITSARDDIQYSTQSSVTGTLKDNRPHRYTSYLHFRDEYQFQGYNRLSVLIQGQSRPQGNFNTDKLRIGRSVLGLVSAPGIVQGRVKELGAVLAPTNPQSRSGSLPTDVVFFEHTNEKLLPGSWMGYDLLQAMVIEDFPYSKLSPAQETAIVQWVENGGTLLVSPGKTGNVLKSNLLKRLARFEEAGAVPLDQPPIKDLPKSGSKVIRWDVNVPGADDTQLARTVACGSGKVVILKYDILRAPFSEWSGLEGTLAKTIRIPAKHPQHPKFELHWPDRAKQLPGAATVAAILGAYLLALGPANYLILRRKKKLVLMPFTIAGIAVSFTILIIIYGYVSRGMSTELRQFTLIRTRPDRTTAFATTQKGIYASSNKPFVMSFDDSTALRKVTDRRGWGSDESPLKVADSGDGTLDAKFTSLMWEVFTLEARAPVPEFGSLRLVSTRDGPQAVNATTIDLQDCWLKKSGKWHKIGKLPTGARKSPGAVGRPPADVLKILRDSPWGKNVLVVGKPVEGAQPAIPWEMKSGHATIVLNSTYVVGEAQ
ncbi:MAG: hypothetical protein HQ592_18510 [Planctomycetes bacterium]|nr:hypothetical protein [Planctomycetota bacterium]